MRNTILWVSLAVILLAAGRIPATAHEFWLEPHRSLVEPGEIVQTSLRVGIMMRGTELPYLSNNLRSFTITDRNSSRDVKAFEGDLPALTFRAETPGLQVIAYHSTPAESVFEDWETFQFYLSYEGLEAFEALHRERGLPEFGFKEHYSRHAKALVQVGPVTPDDGDAPSGVPLELVAEQNPYTPGLKQASITLLRAGEPLPEHPVAVHHYDGEVRRRLVLTDAEGRLQISLAAGGRFLLNAVDIQPVESGDVVWESDWATLTFSLPVVVPEPHPLDPLSRIEIARAVRVIGKSGHATAETRVALITLAEPSKATVLAWQPGAPIERRAFAVIRNGPRTFEATVDLVSGTLEHWQEVPGVQPPISSAEWVEAQRLTKQDARWLAAMRLRGYDDVTEIFCESLTAGYFGEASARSRRLLKMPCYDRSGAHGNIYGRPIEGLISVVDLNARAVIEVIDSGVVPVSQDTHRLDEAAQPDLRAASRPVSTAAPAGWNFTVNQRWVTWQHWSFHIGFDQRFGPVVSLVTHADSETRRSVLYQGHLSEVFVPYMDADEGWYYRAYMDAGEYGLGALASPLAAGLDCPEGAVFLDAHLSTHLGAPYTRERVMCLFERDVAAPLWRHWEALDGVYEGRPATELVLRAIPSIANYDYVIDWVFTQKGEIHVNLGATGIDAVKGVTVESMADAGAATETASGVLVAPNLVAVHHDHYFSFRLDLDVDGPVNSFRRARLVTETLPSDQQRRSLWRLQPVEMPVEGALSLRQGPELWRIENPKRETALGHRPSYQIAVDSPATSLLSSDDWPQRRAEFSAETLWITAHKPGERFAGGAYPLQSTGGQGLPAYVDGESIEETDLVAWATLGFHHLTRPEDWPVLPTIWHSLRLRPYGFFTQNPGLGVRRDFLEEKTPK